MNTKNTDLTRRKALALSAGCGALLINGSATAQSTLKTPGVYIVEKNVFPNSVAEVATSVPAFIGNTEKTTRKVLSRDNVLQDKTTINKPLRITSMDEFHKIFGGAPAPKFDLVKAQSVSGTNGSTGNGVFPQIQTSLTVGKSEELYNVVQTSQPYTLYGAMRHFFVNGGGACYIVSTGDYTNTVDAGRLKAAITNLEKEREVTMLVIPEAVRLQRPNAINVQQAMLAHCGGKMKNRFAILDIHGGHSASNPQNDPIKNFRKEIGSNFLGHAAAYHPWLETNVFQSNEFTYHNLTDSARTLLVSLGVKATDKTNIAFVNKIKQMTPTSGALQATGRVDMQAVKTLDKALRTNMPIYIKVMNAIAEFMNCMPPSAAMAGVYTQVDNSRGVWKAPANIALKSVVAPSIEISQTLQQSLNVTPDGKSINAIRSFPGEGTLVWGARTLDGNSLDWRYINVRRTLIMLEESIKLAAKAYVFEPNTANTWVSMKTMINTFLTDIWKRGGLVGATPADAFSVSVGLGSTMTTEDILEGILRITVLVAVARPAEFIEITFQQQMQKS